MSKRGLPKIRKANWQVGNLPCWSCNLSSCNSHRLRENIEGEGLWL